MTYEEIWQKIKRMGQRDRKQLAYEMTLKGLNVGYVHPHYYFDAKGMHTILFYPKGSQHETDDKDGKYFNALKEIIENDTEIHVRVKRYVWLPRFINDWREGEIVKSYICSRYNDEWVNRCTGYCPVRVWPVSAHAPYSCGIRKKTRLYTR